MIDFKTSEGNRRNIPLYSRQLHAYAYALENPAPGKLGLSPISRLGLLCVEPQQMIRGADGSYSYLAKPVWLECPRNDEGFFSFLDEVLGVLESPDPPPPGESCEWCRYRATARGLAL